MRRNVAPASNRNMAGMRTFSCRAVEARAVLCFAVRMDVAHGLRSAWMIVRNAFAREALTVEPEAPPRPRRARSLARALFEIEPLPEDPVAPPRPSRGRGVLRALLAPEPLPEDPVEPPRPTRLRWLSWLLGPEPLDPP